MARVGWAGGDQHLCHSSDPPEGCAKQGSKRREAASKSSYFTLRLFHTCSLIVLMPSVRIYSLKSRENKGKPEMKRSKLLLMV